MNFDFFKKKEIIDFLKEFFKDKIIVTSIEQDQFSKNNSLTSRMTNFKIITTQLYKLDPKDPNFLTVSSLLTTVPWEDSERPLILFLD